MNEAAYIRWWKLHARASQCELLTPSEHAEYESGIRELGAEAIAGDIPGGEYNGDPLAPPNAEREAMRRRLEALSIELTILEASLAGGIGDR